MRKAKVRPPRRPRGEAPSVTIANQANEIRNLIARLEQVKLQRDAYSDASMACAENTQRATVALRQEQEFHQSNLFMLKIAEAEVLRLGTLFEGYRMGVRDALLPIEISDSKPIKIGTTA